ncbi:hypothetical protein SSX86_003378 [Deinandra increscens subsp. villosa]|uniref:BZIP domain-containing protein n=1 Tax=Deinandra increscens subsp. villosa TaxID=3103831 RepID=A0AAP0H6Q5_9ASTR
MKPMDDIWNGIGGLSSPTTTNFQDFFAPATRPPADSTALLLRPPSTTISTLLTNSPLHEDDPNKRPPPRHFPAPDPPQPEYTEKFRRLMKNRESAARSRARKQARADELEIEVRRLLKENAKLKRLQKQACVSQVPKESKLSRTKSAPF